MRHRLAKASVVLALTVSLGAHWAFLQSIAWTGMLYSYTKQQGWSRGIAMTFDGDHPCALCKTIQKGKAAERDQGEDAPQVARELKLDLPPLTFVLNHPPRPALPHFAPVLTALWDHAPDPPPPRFG